MLSVASSPSLTNSVQPTSSQNRQYPGALRSGAADYNLHHYDDIIRGQAEILHTIMLSQGKVIPPGVLCDVIYRYMPVDDHTPDEQRVTQIASDRSRSMVRRGTSPSTTWPRSQSRRPRPLEDSMARTQEHARSQSIRPRTRDKGAARPSVQQRIGCGRGAPIRPREETITEKLYCDFLKHQHQT